MDLEWDDFEPVESSALVAQLKKEESEMLLPKAKSDATEESQPAATRCPRPTLLVFLLPLQQGPQIQIDVLYYNLFRCFQYSQNKKMKNYILATIILSSLKLAVETYFSADDPSNTQDTNNFIFFL